MATADLSSSPAAPASPSRRVHLTPAQQQLLLAATAEVVCATAANRPVVVADPTLAGAADHLVAGAFVSLKRGKHLRACTGGLQDHPVPLGKAVAEAAVRSVLDDVRFPPVSPRELEHLSLEVWLLHSPERVRAGGEDRVAAVQVGKHGLIVARGGQRGLLLPGVAVEHDWDARRFLEQTCVKAGLHPSLWKDDGTAVFTFEGDVFHGRVCEGQPAEALAGPTLPIGKEHLSAYVGFVHDNLRALLAGALPTYYLYNHPDFNVGGVALHLRRPGSGEAIELCNFSLRQGVPLQATLFRLAQEAAQVVEAQQIPPEHIDGMALGLTLLVDVNLHGSLADPELTGLDPRRRAILVLERNRSGLVFHAERQPGDLVADAAELVEARGQTTAPIFSLEILTTEPQVRVATGPRPQPGPALRPAAQAGRFYPADPAELTRLVDEYLAGDAPVEAWPAAMVPHAGLIYSGRIAAGVLRRIRIPSRVIVLGPKHTLLGMEWAVAPHEAWSIPGARVASDPELARRLVRAIPGLTLDAAAHRQEHGIEVELPFLARLAPEVKVVGIAIGHGDLDSCRRFAEGLADVLRRFEEPPLLLISSDMNHFATDAETRQLDALALAALEGLDPEELYDTVTENQISMCGLLPAVIVLETLRRLGRLKKAERCGYATTSDVTGDPSRVVGYAGMLLGG
jgi:AmmeMemoRadiSam system protein B/AmmeMemoRadiSam system protein A